MASAKRRMRAAVALVLLTQATAFAQPPAAGGLFEPEWSTTADGILAILPNPAVGGAGGGIPPFPLFGDLGRGVGGESLWALIHACLAIHPHAWLTLLAPGPQDQGSMNDFAWQLEAQIKARGGVTACDPLVLAHILNRTPMSYIAFSYPIDAFRKWSAEATRRARPL